jgi:hypothetical protein
LVAVLRQLVGASETGGGEHGHRADSPQAHVRKPNSSWVPSTGALWPAHAAPARPQGRAQEVDGKRPFPATFCPRRHAGRIIAGLYAAGEIVGALFLRSYASGTSLMSGETFGRLATKRRQIDLPSSARPSIALSALVVASFPNSIRGSTRAISHL